MDEEILKNLENISDNLEYLIQYLQDKEESKQTNTNDTAALDVISNDFASFNNYLKSIDTSIQLSNQKMSAYLDSISTLENTEVNDNPEIEQFNQSINNLIAKLDDLKNNLGTANVDLNLNIDTTQIDVIKDKLNSEFVLNFNVADIDSTIDEINQKLETLNNVPININLGDSLTNLDTLVTELNNLKDLKLDNLNLDIVNPENIQKVIDELSKLESFSTLNFDSLKESLQEIQKINLDNIDIDKLTELSEINNKTITDINLAENLKTLNEPIKIEIDSAGVANQINSINEEFKKIQSFKIDLDLNVDFTNQIDEIKTELTKTAEELKTSLVIEPQINYKVNPESLETIKNEFDNIELSLNPDTELFSKLKSELDNQVFNVKVNPVLDSSPVIETRNETDFKVIKDDAENTSNDKLLSYMQENNKLLTNLVDALNNNNSSKKEVINVVPETVTTQQSIVNVTPNTPLTSQENNSNDMSSVVSLLRELVDSNKAIVKKMTKSGFNTDIDI
jgi:hypothetical protein